MKRWYCSINETVQLSVSLLTNFLICN